MSLKFKKISGSTPYLLNSASTAEELTLALEDYMRTGAQIIFQHDGEDCILTSFEYKSGIESTVIAYFVTPKKKLLKVDTVGGGDLVITESEFTPETDTTLTQSGKPADAKATGEAIQSVKSTINDLHTTGAETYLIVEDGATPAKFEDAFYDAFGVHQQINLEMVDTPPETMEKSGIGLDKLIYLNVVKRTGIVYADFGDGVMPFGVGFFRQEGFDKGWTDDVNAETEAGVYCVRVFGDFAEKKDITWENLPDKPFGEITENLGDTITWDGNIGEGNDVVVDPEPIGTGTGRYVKVSDAVPTIDDIGSDSTFKYTAQGSEATQKVTPKTDNGIIKIYDGFLFIVIAPTDNIQMGKIVFPKKGVYFTQFFDANGNEIARGASLTIPNYNFGTKTTLKKIDEKYLPESGGGDTPIIGSAEVYVYAYGALMGLAQAWTLDDHLPTVVHTQVVKELPSTLAQTDYNEDGEYPIQTYYMYVVEGTGIAYLDDGRGDGIQTLGEYRWGETSANKGWTEDINLETEEGFYCVRTFGKQPTIWRIHGEVGNTPEASYPFTPIEWEEIQKNFENTLIYYYPSEGNLVILRPEMKVTNEGKTVCFYACNGTTDNGRFTGVVSVIDFDGYQDAVLQIVT